MIFFSTFVSTIHPVLLNAFFRKTADGVANLIGLSIVLIYRSNNSPKAIHSQRQTNFRRNVKLQFRVEFE